MSFSRSAQQAHTSSRRKPGSTEPHAQAVTWTPAFAGVTDWPAARAHVTSSCASACRVEPCGCQGTSRPYAACMEDSQSIACASENLRTVSGLFFRSVLADRVRDVLASPRPGSAGRYHRPGQATLYMSPRQEWAIIAVSGYIREDGAPRVVVPLLVSDAHVLDQHDEVACRALGIDRDLSNAQWRPALKVGQEPLSWRNADAARAAGADGIIDRSRMIPDAWHVNLFRWNELGGPSVSVCGEPVPIELSSDGPKWGL